MIKWICRKLNILRVCLTIPILSLLMIKTIGMLSSVLNSKLNINENIVALCNFIDDNHLQLLSVSAFIALMFILENLLIRIAAMRENRKQCFIAKRLLKSQEELKQNSNRFQAPYRKKRYFEKLSERMDSSSSEDNHKFSKVKNSITLRSRQARFCNKEKTLFNQIQVVKSPNSVSDFSNDETYDNTLKRQEEKLKGDKRISKLDDETKWVARIVYNIDYNKDPIEKILAFENQSPSP